MIADFEGTFDIDVFHAWGMTEMSPVGTNGRLTASMASQPAEKRWDAKAKQGRSIFAVEMKIMDENGKRLPEDGVAFGEVSVRGPWIVSGYYNNREASEAVIDKDGWFRTGDVATIGEGGMMQIVDRSKDVIKSGGEWISSIDLENAAMGHPHIAQAAVIGIAHPKWDERPLLIVVPGSATQPTKDDILEYLEDKIAKWWMPDDVQFVDELPLTSTGKISKLDLRKIFKDYKLPTA